MALSTGIGGRFESNFFTTETRREHFAQDLPRPLLAANGDCWA